MNKCVCVRLCADICMGECVRVCACVCARVCARVCACVCACVCVRACVRAWVRACVCAAGRGVLVCMDKSFGIPSQETLSIPLEREKIRARGRESEREHG